MSAPETIDPHQHGPQIKQLQARDESKFHQTPSHTSTMTLYKDMNEDVMAVDAVVWARPFPFLRLPKDIRFMIYDLLQPNTNKHIRISNDPERDPYCAVLVVRTFDMAILRTCKTVNDEARALLYKTARQLFTKCAAQIVLPKGDAQENMITTFLGAVKDSYKSLCATHGARGSQDMFII